MNAPMEHAEFVQLLASFQRRLFGYIATFLPSPSDTEDVLQQTNLVLWSKAGEFRPGSSFRAWAFRIAYLEVTAFRRRGSRDRQLFSAELAATMADEVNVDEDQSASEALSACLDQLPSRDRQLLMHRYGGQANVRQVADALGRPVTSIYRSLERIRFVLLACIQRKLATEGDR